MPVNRRKFLKQAAGVPLAAQLMPAAPPPASAPFRSYAEEMPDMLLQYLANKTNTLAAGWDQNALRFGRPPRSKNVIVSFGRSASK